MNEQDESGSKSQQQQGRQAAQRLTGVTTEFDQLVNLIYEYREHAPGAESEMCQIMRKVLGVNMNIRDKDAIKAVAGLIKEARTKRIQDAVQRMGFDEAEKLLGMKEGGQF